MTSIITFLRLYGLYRSQWGMGRWDSLNAAWHTVRGDWVR